MRILYFRLHVIDLECSNAKRRVLRRIATLLRHGRDQDDLKWERKLRRDGCIEIEVRDIINVGTASLRHPRVLSVRWWLSEMQILQLGTDMMLQEIAVNTSTCRLKYAAFTNPIYLPYPLRVQLNSRYKSRPNLYFEFFVVKAWVIGSCPTIAL